MNLENRNVPYRSIAILLFTVLLSSCLKETAVPIESAFIIETSEDKTSPVRKTKVTGQTNMNGLLRVAFQAIPTRKIRVRLCSLKPVSTR